MSHAPARPTRRSRYAQRLGSEPPRGAPRFAEGFAPSPVYRRRRPQATHLYEVVQHHLETFLALADEGDLDRLPPPVEPEFQRYLTCGILAFGFARIRCQDCRRERLLAFSCKGRCVCPSWTNRRMADVATHLTDSVIPAVPVRQWVLSAPKRLRPQLAGDPTLCSAVLRILLHAIRAEFAAAAGPGLLIEARLEAISFLHRFGSGLNPHPHFHPAVTEGLFSRDLGDPNGPLRFHPARHLDAERARRLTPILQRRILPLYARRGLLSDADAGDMLTWRAIGGFSLDGSVPIAAHDRAGLERVLRYCARPPFALHRLRSTSSSLASPDARLIYTLPRPDRTGRTATQLSPIELLQRLAG